MIKNIKNIIFFICLAGILWSDTKVSSPEEVYPLDLKIYDGSGSLLLDWYVLDKITFKEFKIFRKAGLSGKYNLIANLSADNIKNNRYLDVNCKNNTRYFYYIEGKDIDHNIYKSDYLKPSFGSIKKQHVQKIQIEENAWGLFCSIIREKIA